MQRHALPWHPAWGRRRLPVLRLRRPRVAPNLQSTLLMPPTPFPGHTLPCPYCSFDEFGRPRKKESAADREAREKAALDRLNVSPRCFALRMLQRCMLRACLRTPCTPWSACINHMQRGSALLRAAHQLCHPIVLAASWPLRVLDMPPAAAPCRPCPPTMPAPAALLQARYREEGGRERSRSPVRR